MNQRRPAAAALVAVVVLLPAAACGDGGQPTGTPEPAVTITPATDKIAFWSNRDGNDEIYVMNADGSGQTRLTNNPASDVRPAWSPDGTKIAFESYRDGNEEIYVMNADGSGQTRLTNNPGPDWTPAWSPDGTKIAFTSSRDSDLEIYVMNADGSGQTRLSNGGGTDPAWSPDGTNIAFDSVRDSNGEIYVMNADGSGPTRLTNNPARDVSPSWSPDGTKIAFQSDRDGNDEIYVMNADGSGQTRLTNNPGPDWTPAWSPDGTKIAFDSLSISVMNADGSGLTRLPSDYLDSNPAWSPGAGTVGITGDGETRVSHVYIDPDPSTPLISRYDFVSDDPNPVTRVEFYGSKAADDPTSEWAYIYFIDFEEPLVMTADELGRPDQMLTPDGGAFKIEYRGATALVHFLAPDGSYGVVPVPLDQEAQDALEDLAVLDVSRRRPDALAHGTGAVAQVAGSRVENGRDLVAAASAVALAAGAARNQVEKTKKIDATSSVTVAVMAFVQGVPTWQEESLVTFPYKDVEITCSGVPCQARATLVGLGKVTFHVSFAKEIEVPFQELSNRQHECDQLFRSDVKGGARINWGSRLVLGVLGGALGSFFGNLPGGIAGAAAGYSIASAIDDAQSAHEALTPQGKTCLWVATQKAVVERLGRDEAVITVCLRSDESYGYVQECQTKSYLPYDPARAKTLDLTFTAKEPKGKRVSRDVGEGCVRENLLQSGVVGGLLRAPPLFQQRETVDLFFGPGTCDVTLVSQPPQDETPEPEPSPDVCALMPDRPGREFLEVPADVDNCWAYYRIGSDNVLVHVSKVPEGAEAAHQVVLSSVERARDSALAEEVTKIDLGELGYEFYTGTMPSYEAIFARGSYFVTVSANLAADLSATDVRTLLKEVDEQIEIALGD